MRLNGRFLFRNLEATKLAVGDVTRFEARKDNEQDRARGRCGQERGDHSDYK